MVKYEEDSIHGFRLQRKFNIRLAIPVVDI